MSSISPWFGTAKLLSDLRDARAQIETKQASVAVAATPDDQKLREVTQQSKERVPSKG